MEQIDSSVPVSSSGSYSDKLSGFLIPLTEAFFCKLYSQCLNPCNLSASVMFQELTRDRAKLLLFILSIIPDIFN